MRYRLRTLLIILAIAPPIVGMLCAQQEVHTIPAKASAEWFDAVEGKRWEELRREIGSALSKCKEAGPIRCKLIRTPADDLGPQLKLELTNVSKVEVKVQVFQMLLDNVTFILRAPDGSVVSSFCYLTVHSPSFDQQPHAVVIGPDKSQSAGIYVSTATDHGSQSLRAGVYSLEAVFHDLSFSQLPLPDFKILARSNRIAIRVKDE